MTYSGSPNSYFRQLPDLDYPSLENNRNSIYDYKLVKNIFKRAVMRDDIFDSVTAFTKYSVQDDERPDQVAYNFYQDSGLDWVVLTTNNIIHVRDEWPMGSQDFLTYLNAKYTEQGVYQGLGDVFTTDDGKIAYYGKPEFRSMKPEARKKFLEEKKVKFLR